MKNKNKAIKALISLIAFLLVCMFLSRTVQTITTPKVKRIQASYGRLEEKIRVNGEVFFKNSEEFKLQEAKDMGVSVEEVHCKEGYFLKKGDLIAKTSVGSYEEKKKEIETNIRKVAKERASEFNGSIRLAHDSEQNQINQRVLDKNEQYYVKLAETKLLAKNLGYDLKGAVSDWGTPPAPAPKPGEKTAKTEKVEEKPKEVLNQDAPPELKKLIDDTYKVYLEKLEAEDLLKQIYNRRYGQRIPDLVFTHIKKLYEFDEKIADEEAKLEKLNDSYQKVKEIKAPRDGYVTKLNLKKGEAVEGTKTIFALSKTDELPYLRFDISEVKRTLKEGMNINLDGSYEEFTISEIYLGDNNKKYALVKLTNEQISGLGGLNKLLSSGVQGSISYKSDKQYTIIPASALRSESEKETYVYVVEPVWSGFMGNEQFKLKKTPVTVIAKTNTAVAISEDISYYSIADREDRAIKDGQTVMDYVE